MENNAICSRYSSNDHGNKDAFIHIERTRVKPNRNHGKTGTCCCEIRSINLGYNRNPYSYINTGHELGPGEKVISGILAAAAAVGILAVALGAIGGGVGAAVVATSLAAGIAAATIAINAGKRQVSSYQASARSGRSAYPTSAYSAVSYRMPRLATGTVVPPRAGEFAAILGDNKREPEVVSPLSTIEQGVENALSRHNFGGGDITIKFTGSLSELVRLLKPELDKETSRRGANLVIGGTGG